MSNAGAKYADGPWKYITGLWFQLRNTDLKELFKCTEVHATARGSNSPCPHHDSTKTTVHITLEEPTVLQRQFGKGDLGACHGRGTAKIGISTS